MVRQRWVVLDPTFNLCFVRPDGALASFADVQKDWSYYSRQVPAGYNPTYRYEDVRYSNWTKIPVIFPALRSLLNLVIGPERTNDFSIRILFLNSFSICLYIVLAIYCPLVLITIRKLARQRSSHSQSFYFQSSHSQTSHSQTSRVLPSGVGSMMSNS
jgi:hypothetical protein